MLNPDVFAFLRKCIFSVFLSLFCLICLHFGHHGYVMWRPLLETLCSCSLYWDHMHKYTHTHLHTTCD